MCFPDRPPLVPVTHDGLDVLDGLGARHLIFGSVTLLIRYTAAFSFLRLRRCAPTS